MNSVSNAVQAAQSHLDAAKFCCEHSHEGLAVSEAYYAMYHVVRAWALQVEGEAPGTHKGIGFFLHQLVEAGQIDASLRDDFHDAKASRERWHYEGRSPLPTTDPSMIIQGARGLVDVVAR